MKNLLSVGGLRNEFRIIVNADELDKNLTSTREAVKDSQPFSQLKEYIKKKFNNEVRKYYFDQQLQMEENCTFVRIETTSRKI